MKVEKAIELYDARISFVSLVDKAANLRPFLITKAKGNNATFNTYGKILKVDSEKHYITGVVYEPMVEDAHGNFMTEEEIQKACYWFSKNGDQVDLQHSFKAMDSAAVVENWIAKSDEEIGGVLIKKGTWLITVEISDDTIWEAVEKGEITGFSMGGMGKYGEEDVELAEVNKETKPVETEELGIVKTFLSKFGFNFVQKGEVMEIFQQKSKGSLFWNAFSVLENYLYGYNNSTGRWQFEADEETVRQALADFNDIISSILLDQNVLKSLEEAAPINQDGPEATVQKMQALCKAIVPEKEEDKQVTKAEVQDIVKEVLAEAGTNAMEGIDLSELVKAELQKVAGQQEPPAAAAEPAEESVTKEDVAEIVKAQLAEFAKAAGVPSNLNNDGEGHVAKADDDLFAPIFG